MEIKCKYWEYKTDNGHSVYAGKTDYDNDYLTLKVAKPYNIWFHAKGVPGSHVILLCNASEAEKSDIEKAAAIAAYHSKYRTAKTAPVTYTQAGNVTKKSGMKPGSVLTRREKTIKVKPGID